MKEYDDDGLPKHLAMGVTKQGYGPVAELHKDFDHYICWCGEPGCEKYKELK